jgi:cell division protein FtsZ
MSINLSVPQNESVELKPRITVVGVGGAGGNAVNNMIEAKLGGVEFLVANTDAQALTFSKTDNRIQLGSGLTQGLGAGSKPEIGRAAAEESIEEITAYIKGSHMVFIAAGMGGGTGSGAAPVIARTARDLGVLTVGVVTKPFQFEGQRRQRIADKGIEDLEQYVDTLIVIPNQNLFRVANEKTTFADAFNMADDVLYSGVRGITDLMVMPGLINLDFADVRSVMSEMGKAMMGTGEASGERRALDAAEAAISNPLLDDTSMAGANGVLINITGGSDMTLYEVDEAANRIRSEVDEDAYIIFGSTYDDTMDGMIRVSVVATGIDAEFAVRPEPAILNMNTHAVSPVTQHEQSHVGETDFANSVAQVLSETTPDTIENALQTNEEIADSIVNDALSMDVQALDDVLADEDLIDNDAEESVETFAAPAGTPSALNEDVFIPPAASDGMARTQIDPLAEAALLNEALVDADVAQQPAAQADQAPQSAPSLFARVTGGMNKVAAFGQKNGGLSAAKRQADGVGKPVDAISQGTSTVMRNSGSAELEPTLAGLNLEDRTPQSQPEDDLLDIPAFLRRQAN